MRNSMYRFVSFVLAVAIVFTLVPAAALPVFAQEAESETGANTGTTVRDVSYFAGKKVSILGDSISTYAGVSNNKKYNSTISRNVVHYTASGLYDGVFQKDTWWQQAIDALGMELCVNNSWSGSCIFSQRAGTVGCYATRCEQLHNDNTGEEPDVIWIFMGTNDWSYFGDTWGDVDDVDYDTLFVQEEDGSYTYATPTTVFEAYAITLHKIQMNYPNAEVYCMGLMARNERNYNVPQPTEMNASLRVLIDHFGYTYVDLESCVSADAEDFKLCMGDNRVHPNKEGMDRITQELISTMLGGDIAVHDVEYSLTGMTLSNDTHAVVDGQPYNAILCVEDGCEVANITVTMGGEEITDFCYSRNTISISKVTGPIEITADVCVAVQAEDYRWELSEKGNALESIVSEIFSKNDLDRISGSVAEGLFSGYVGAFDEEITLWPTKEWAIEWKSSGDWSGMMLISGESYMDEGAIYLYRNAAKILCIGTRMNSSFNNYGLDTSGIDMSQEHVFRLENRVSRDGTNMVYLVVDDIEIGALNNHYVGSTLRGTSNWLSGQVIRFRYFGVSGFAVSGLKLEYLEILSSGEQEHRHAYACKSETEGTCVSEGYYTYACGCGESYTVSNGQLGSRHTYGVWVLADGQLRRDCDDCDAFETTELEGYRWEMNEDGNALVSVTTNGNTENVLNQTNGSINGGVLSNVIGKFDSTVTLLPTEEWTIEWKSSGDWSGMLLISGQSINDEGAVYIYRNAAKLLTIGTRADGKFNNYGVDTNNLDMSGEHIYRLENRIFKDGSNMVYLVIDAEEIGAMNNYYVGSNLQGTSNWLSSQTLTFNYFGVSTFPVTNMDLEYLQIWKNGLHKHVYSVDVVVESTCISEGYTVYACSCGDSYRIDNGSLADHSYGKWTVVDGGLRRECRHCDAFETTEWIGYRWEMDADGDALISVTTNENRDNVLTQTSGTISGGVLNNVVGNLGSTVTLLPTDEWVIEWKSSGDWSGMMLISGSSAGATDVVYLYRNSAKLLTIGSYYGGTYHNYGVDTTDLDMTGTHIFRLENRVAEDGSNMIYLIVDGAVIGAMDNHYDRSAYQGKSDWLSGKVLTFNYFGAAGFQVTNMELEYLQIWTNGSVHQHTYEQTEKVESTCATKGYTRYSCHCGDSYDVADDTLKEHTFGIWRVVGNERRRACAYCDAYETELLYGFRWEYSAANQAMASITANGNTKNTLSLVTGNIGEDGTFDYVVYKLSNTVTLYPDIEWVIEWEASGDWNGMLLSSDNYDSDGMSFLFRKSTTDLLALGTKSEGVYHNYGIDTSDLFDVEKVHTYRLENRVADDGSNMIYLVVDDIEIGAMNNYHENTTDRGQVDNWLSGKTLTFNYIGKSEGSHNLTGIKLNYLQVWINGVEEHKHAYTVTATTEGTCVDEIVNTYVCSCGHTYTGGTGTYGDHSFGPWITYDTERQRTCTLCGDIQTVKLGTFAEYDEAASDDYYNVIYQKDYILCDGVTESEIVINNDDASRRQVLHIVEVDVTNPNVEILPGYYGIDKDLTNPQNWSTTTTEVMMDYYRDELGYNIVAGMNVALGYDSAAPFTYLVYNGELIAPPDSIYYDACTSYLAVMKNADGTVYCELRLKSEPLHGDEWQAFSCNFGFVIEDGQLVDTSENRSSGADRSMIGIKADGTLVIVQAEGRNAPYSTGLSSYELGETMLALGCVWAVNGDGGGSSQILTKREGESDYELRNNPSDGVARATIHSILIASKVEESGVFDHASLLVESEYITPGNSVNVEVKGVDGSGMPAELPDGIVYEATGGTYKNGVFISNGTLGTQTVTAYYNGEKVGSVEIQVVIPTSIVFDSASMAVPFGKTVEIGITAYYGAFEVAISGADIIFELSEDIGTISGLNFTAPMESDVSIAELTATLVYNLELSVTIPVYVGKGSEVLYDFEDQSLHGWYRSTAINYNAIFVGGATSLVDSTTGHVHSGNYAMRVELDYSNSLEPGFMLGTLVPGEKVILENAMTIGMWVYLPDEADGMMIDVQVPVYDSNSLGVVTRYLTGQATIVQNGKEVNTAAGFIYAYDESGWHYITIDVSSEMYVGLPTLKCYMHMEDGLNDYVYGEQTNVNGNFVLYVDDITVDYSQAVDDREIPVFGEMTYQLPDMADPEALDGNVVASGNVSFAVSVMDDTAKANYTGIDTSSGRVYIDGIDYTQQLSWSDSTMMLNGVVLSNGMHTVKFVVCDNMGNRSAIVRTIIVGSVDDADVKVVAHDPDADRILTGSLYYIDVVADDPETIQSVTVTLDLNNISVWQLDHMEVAKGFKAEYTLIEDENIATVTITSVGKTNLSGEDQILVSIPIRTWELPVEEPIYGHNGEVYMYDDYKAKDSVLPMDLNVEIDGGYVVYKDGSNDSFTCPKIQVMTELSGHAYTQSGSASMNYIANESWYADWNGGHDHRPETKQYYDETSTNHVDAVLLQDKAPTCTEEGYTGRTYCEVCNSVVDWGTTVPATDHTYGFDNGVLKCQCGELFNGVYTDGKTYEDGVVSSVNGWIGDSYYKDGTMVTGIQKVPAPDDASVEYYYDFGENGICRNQMKYTGMFQDGDVYRYAYIGELASGWQTIDGHWHYFSPQTMASVSGVCVIDGIEFEFEENGKLVTGVWVIEEQGKRYCYGPGYYETFWYEIDGELYYFEGSYALTGIHYVRRYGYLERAWAEFAEDGVFVQYVNGFVTDQEGHLFYAVDGEYMVGLHLIDGDYYFFAYNRGAVTGKYYAWETHCDLPCDNYEFGEDGKMLQGLVQKDDGLYYYVNGKAGTAGLTKIGEDYYFVGSSGRVATGSYYAWATNCDLPCATYVFGEDGKMLNPPVMEPDEPEVPGVKNGLVQEADGIYYYVNGKYGPAGLTKIGDYYYFVSSRGRVATGTYDCWATNCELPCGIYTFDEEGRMIDPPGSTGVKNGLVQEADGIYYYVNGKYGPAGLTKIGNDYYFVSSKGRVATGSYYCWATNCELPCGTYEFDEQGRMIKNGLFTESNGIYYYVDGEHGPAGLTKIGDYYYFVSSIGRVATGSYYCWATNCELPCGTYEFDEQGRMIDPPVTVKNGLVQETDGIYYYVNGKYGPAGLTKLGDYYYFVSSRGRVATGTYDCWATNCELPCGIYTFDEEGRMIDPPGSTEVKNGLVQEDDGIYYYVNGKYGPAGLTKIGDYYYFVSSIGRVATGSYYCWATNCELPCGTYEFDEQGKMIDPPVAEVTITYEKYINLTADEQTAYRDSFESTEAFFTWFNAAKEGYEAQHPGIDVGDGNVNLEDLINNGSNT